MSETRAALKAAAKKAATLKNQIHTLEDARERAQATADQAQQELTRHSGLDKEITRWRVDQVKKGASTKVLPASLQAKVNGRRDAQEELEQSHSTIEAIREELETMTAQLARVEAEQRDRAVDVVRELEHSLAGELRTINERRTEILQLLRGLSVLEVPGILDANGRPTGIGITTSTLEVVEMGQTFPFPVGADPLEEMARRWGTRLAAVCADPDAEITTPKHLTPSDYVPGRPREFIAPGLPWAPGTPGTWKPEQP